MTEYRGIQAPRNSTLAEKIAFYSVEIGKCTYWHTHRHDPQAPVVMRWEGQSFPVQRLVWSAAHGPIPEGRKIIQTCGHRGCIRLEHQALGGRSGGRKVERPRNEKSPTQP